MTKPQRLLLVVAQVAVAIGLATYFVEWRTEDRVWSVEAKREVAPSGLIVPLGSGGRVIGLQDNPTAEVGTITGIYVRPDRLESAAAIGGVLIPVLLLVAAAYTALGWHKRPD